MTDCQLELIDGKWTCPNCDWVYPRPAAKPPRRNCPARRRLPSSAELIEQVRRVQAERLQCILPAMLPEISRRVLICHGNPCGKFNGRTCTDRGKICSCWRRWMERLAIGKCDCWKGRSTNDE